MSTLREKAKRVLAWSQTYAKTDMVYVAKSGFWTTLNFAVGGAVALLLAAAFANLLPKETYGTYKYILSIAGAFGFLSLTGMNTAVTRATARGHDGALPESVRIQLRWNLIYTAVLTCLGAYYLVRHGAFALGVSLLILGALTPPAWAFATFSSLLAGKKDFKRSAKYSILGSLLYLAIMLIGIVFGRSPTWLVVAYAISNCLVYALLYALTIARYKPKGMDAAERREMLDFSKHLSVVNVFATIAQQIDNIAVFKFLGPAQLAVYAFAGLMPDRIRNFGKTGMGIIMPKLSAKNLPEVMRSFRLRLVQSFAIGTLFAVGYVLIAPPLFRLLFPRYVDAILYSQLIALNLVFTVPITYMAYVHQSQKLIPEIYATSLASNGLRIALMPIGGALFGILGVIAGKLVGNMFGVLISALALRRALKRHAVASSEPVA